MSWSAVLTSPYNSETDSVFAIGNGFRRRIDGRFSAEWGIDPPYIIPTISAGSGAGLTGAYNAKYTYARKERQAVVCESNSSGAATAAVTLTNNSILITASSPDDDQVNCVRFYRTTAGGTSYYYTGEKNYCNRQYAVTHGWEETDQYITGMAWRFTIEDSLHSTEDCYTWELLYSSYTLNDNLNCITNKADNLLELDDSNTDSVLGILLHGDHNRPPEGASFVFGPTANGTLFILKNNRAYYCKPQQPEYWPSLYYVDVSSVQYPLVCGAFHDSRTYLFDKRNIYYLAGVQFADLPGLTTFRPYPQEAQSGAVNAECVESVLGYGIFHVGLDGIYRFMPGEQSGTDQRISEAIDPIFRGESINDIPAISDITYSWLEWFDEKLYFAYVSGTETSPRNIIVFDFVKKKIMYYVYQRGMAVSCHDKFNKRLLTAGSSGNLYKIEDIDADSDFGESIQWEIETKQFMLQTRKHYPRWNKYDIDARNAENVVASSVLNNSTIQTHVITGNRITRRRLIDLKNGERFSIRLTGDGPVTIYAVESE